MPLRRLISLVMREKLAMTMEIAVTKGDIGGARYAGVGDQAGA